MEIEPGNAIDLSTASDSIKTALGKREKEISKIAMLSNAIFTGITVIGVGLCATVTLASLASPLSIIIAAVCIVAGTVGIASTVEWKSQALSPSVIKGVGRLFIDDEDHLNELLESPVLDLYSGTAEGFQAEQCFDRTIASLSTDAMAKMLKKGTKLGRYFHIPSSHLRKLAELQEKFKDEDWSTAIELIFRDVDITPMLEALKNYSLAVATVKSDKDAYTKSKAEYENTELLYKRKNRSYGTFAYNEIHQKFNQMNQCDNDLYRAYGLVYNKKHTLHKEFLKYLNQLLNPTRLNFILGSSK